jgi:twitching motility protein PilT
MSFKDWTQKGRELGASDLHLETGTPVVFRIRGELTPIGEPVGGARLVEVGRELLGAEAWNRFVERGSADVSMVASGLRCRVSLFRTIRGVAMAVRLLAPAVSDLRSCNLHLDLRKLVEATSGLVVISGPTGSGKSTTLAALIEEINISRARNIITLEAPLEYIFANRKSFVRQREIPTHSANFEQAIVDALRENPDVLVVSEMRTPEVIRLTLNAAETGISCSRPCTRRPVAKRSTASACPFRPRFRAASVPSSPMSWSEWCASDSSSWARCNCACRNAKFSSVAPLRRAPSGRDN